MLDNSIGIVSKSKSLFEVGAVVMVYEVRADDRSLIPTPRSTATAWFSSRVQESSKLDAIVVFPAKRIAVKTHMRDLTISGLNPIVICTILSM